jgi:anti-anti-sigma factor
MEVKLLHTDNGSVHVETAGVISREEITSGRDPFEALAGPDVYRRRVLLNVSKCNYLDSTGVGWLLACHRRFQEGGGMLVVHSATPVLLQILKMMRMDLALHLAADEAAALKKASG